MHPRTISRRQLISHTVAGGLALGLGPRAFAQEADWPRSPIKLVVPFSPAGVTDLVMRSVSKRVSEHIGQTVIIDNRPGAGGVVGMTAVAKAEPNGYTIGAVASSTIIATPLTNHSIPFEVKDFAFVSLLAMVPMVLTVNSSLNIHSAAELLKYIEAHKGQLNYGSTAVGHYGHVALLELSEKMKAGMVHSPYKGEAPLMQDLLGGQLQMAFFAPSTIKPSADAGAVRLLGVSGTKRLSSLPNVPTLSEQGFELPIFKMNPGWVGIVAPAKTPRAIVQKLSAEYVAAIRDPAVNKQINDFGLDPVGSTAEEFAATFRRELPVWRELLAKAGLDVR
jgi:tripartite-type tricarboxylate transporter receptor subunit TctC